MPISTHEPEDPITYDPDQANQILDDAGYDEGPTASAPCRTAPIPLVYQLYARQNSKTSQTTIELLQGWLEDIGIDSTARDGFRVPAVRRSPVKARSTCTSGAGSIEPDPDYQASDVHLRPVQLRDREWHRSTAGLNDSFYCDPEYDKLYEQQALETDPDSAH